MAINCIFTFYIFYLIYIYIYILKLIYLKRHTFRYGQLLHYRCFIQLELGSEDF